MKTCVYILLIQNLELIKYTPYMLTCAALLTENRWTDFS